MVTNRVSNIVLLLIVLVAALLTVSFVAKPTTHAAISLGSEWFGN